MVTSNYMPDVVVQVAFNAGYGTSPASRVWTDISPYVELDQGIDITVGRTDERSTASANTLTLTLDNRDGRFTPERAASPYFPNVKLYRPIQVLVTPPGGTQVQRFIGYVTEWPKSWPGSDATSYVKIKAVSRMQRCGSGGLLRSMLEEEVFTDAPFAYYTLAEPSGALVASDTSGNNNPALSPAVNPSGTTNPVLFGDGTGPGSDGMTATSFTANGKYLQAPLDGLTSPIGLMCWVSFASAPTAAAWLVTIQADSAGSRQTGIQVTTTGLVVGVNGSNAASSSSSIIDGQVHHIAFIYDSATGFFTLFVDGVGVASCAGTQYTDGALLSVGGSPLSSNPTQALTMSHVAVYTTASRKPSTARVNLLYRLGMGTFSETVGQRFARLLTYSGVGGWVSASSAATAVTAQQTSGKTLLDNLRDLESTENGILFDDPSNETFTLQSRSFRYGAAVALVLDMSLHQVGADFQPTTDTASLLNDVTVNGATAVSRYTDPASIADYGDVNDTLTSLASDPGDPIAVAQWLVNTHRQPHDRVPTLTVDVINCGLDQNAVAALAVSSLVQIVNQPSQAAAASKLVFVEGWNETFGPEAWVITFNVSPGESKLVWQLDSTFASQLDSSTVIAL